MSLFQSAINATCVPAGSKVLQPCDEALSSASDQLLIYEVYFFISSSALLLWTIGFQLLQQRVKPPQRDIRLIEMGGIIEKTTSSRIITVAQRVNEAFVPVVIALILLSCGVGIHQIRQKISLGECTSLSEGITRECEWGLSLAATNFLGGLRG